MLVECQLQNLISGKPTEQIYERYNKLGPFNCANRRYSNSHYAEAVELHCGDLFDRNWIDRNF